MFFLYIYKNILNIYSSNNNLLFKKMAKYKWNPNFVPVISFKSPPTSYFLFASFILIITY